MLGGAATKKSLFTENARRAWFKKALLTQFVNSSYDPAGVYMFKVNNRNTRTRREICLKITIKTQEQSHCRRSGVFIVNFEHISNIVLVFLLLTLKETQTFKAY